MLSLSITPYQEIIIISITSCFSYAGIQNNPEEMVKKIFQMQEVHRRLKDVLNETPDELHRIMNCLCSNNNESVSKYMIKELRLFVGDEKFADAAFLSYRDGKNVIQRGIENSQLGNLKLMFDIAAIKQKCKDDRHVLKGIVRVLCESEIKKPIMEYCIKELSLTKKIINELRQLPSINVLQIEYYDATNILTLLK